MKYRGIVVVLGVLILTGGIYAWKSGVYSCARTHTCFVDPSQPYVAAIDATVENSCAPWDGHALLISMPYKVGTFSAFLFATGLEAFEKGQTVTLNASSDSTKGTGVASVCNGDVCTAYKPGDVQIINNTAFIEPNVPANFSITVKGETLRVKAHWQHSNETCGGATAH